PLTISKDMIGTSLSIQVQATDFHGRIGMSEEQSFSVHPDEAPFVSITYPSPGMHVINGLPFEIRANAVDDTRIAQVDFYVEDRLIGSDLVHPYIIEYQATSSIYQEQSLKIFAEAIDNNKHKTRSLPVFITAGKDEKPPVVNIVSPEITGIYQDNDMAEVIEHTSVVLKISGYDNVGVNRLEIYGVQKQDNQYVVTGQPDHVLDQKDMPIQVIPDSINAFSALKLIQIPFFTGNQDILFDQYPIDIDVFDTSGNVSHVSIIIAVKPDTLPFIVDVTSDRPSYYAHHTVLFNVMAKDDCGVERIEMAVYSNDENKPIPTVFKEMPVSFKNLQTTLSLPLESLTLTNQAYTIRTEFVAIDTRGNRSDLKKNAYPYTIVVQPDIKPPIVTLSQPINRTPLYWGEHPTFFWKCIDESSVDIVDLYIDGQLIRRFTPRQASANNHVSYQIPDDLDSMQLELHATDHFGNKSIEYYQFPLIENTPPIISIRSPPAGSRLIEGELFTLNLLPTDNRQTTFVSVYVKTSDAPQLIKKFEKSEIEKTVDNNTYLSLDMRTPHKPDNGSPAQILIVATDDMAMSSETILDIDILDDTEKPRLSITAPVNDFLILPGESFEIKGKGEDNICIQHVQAVLVNSSNERFPLPWFSYAANESTKSITIPNPNSFGTVLVGQRFYMDFSGRISIPESWTEYAGEPFQIMVSVSDYGIYTETVSAANLTIDSKDSIHSEKYPPVLSILKPNEKSYESQGLAGNVQLSDDMGIASYKIYIDGVSQQILAEASGLTNIHSIHLLEKDLPIDHTQFDPITNTTFSFIVEAIDIEGQQVREVRLIHINKDLPPIVSIVDEYPQKTVTKGGLSFQTFEITDDYATIHEPVLFFPVYSSLMDDRSPMGKSLVIHQDETHQEHNPYVSFSYPEADGISASLNINGRPYIQVQNQHMHVFACPTITGQSSGFLTVDAGSEYSILYHVKYFQDNECHAMPKEETINSTLGVPLSLIESYVAVEIVPEILHNDHPVEIFLKQIRIDLKNLSKISSYQGETYVRNVSDKIMITLHISDHSNGEGIGFIASHPLKAFTTSGTTYGSTVILLPDLYDMNQLNIWCHAIDRLSAKRSSIPISVLSQRYTSRDETPPELMIQKPINGSRVVSNETFPIELSVNDNSNGLAFIRLYQNEGELVREIAGTFLEDSVTIPYQVPNGLTNGQLNLDIVVYDHCGNTQSDRLTLPIIPNEAPQIEIIQFAHCKIDDKTYTRLITSRSRINYGEFFLRVNEAFQLDISLNDDAGLEAFEFVRYDSDGLSFLLTSHNYVFQCPDMATLSDIIQEELVFDQTVPTHYKMIVTDTNGRTSEKSFLIHPISNMSPEIRIISPAQDQMIVAGTFQIKVRVVGTDDRIINENNIEIFANNIRLSPIESYFGDDESDNEITKSLLKDMSLSDDIHAQQAFESIYDSIEFRYNESFAKEFGTTESPYTFIKEFVMEMPEGFIKNNQTITLTASIGDIDQAVGNHQLTFIGTADEIKPEIAITRPAIGFGPPENSFFTLGFRAYDNVKVDQLFVFTSYGTRLPDSTYQRSEYGAPVRTIEHIAAQDEEPITTINIDTKEYFQKIQIQRIRDIVANIPGISTNQNITPDIWIKIMAVDASGNQCVREISFPVLPDERPVIDIISPLNGKTVVENNKVIVNVNAFDDVGIDTLRLFVYQGESQSEIHHAVLKQSPWQFHFSVPAYDESLPENNALKVSVEALDTYGAQFNDPDKHLSREYIGLLIIQDQPPVIKISLPKNHEQIIEGDHLLVQINAIDDIGIDHVMLNISGLITGDTTLTDMKYPYEFLIPIPYGQAGHDIQLSANAAEIRYFGNYRRIPSVGETIVHINKDIESPVIVINQPLSEGSIVTEKGDCPFLADITDNIFVSSATIKLFADMDGSGIFSEEELISQQIKFIAPFKGTFILKSINEYLINNTYETEYLMLQIKVTAIDGAGNTGEKSCQVRLIRNRPPEIRHIQILNSKGFKLSDSLETITEGRDIIVNVIAYDQEKGIDNITLYQAIHANNMTPEYKKTGFDVSAPYQFHLTIPKNHVGDIIRFKASARDVDGYSSDLTRTRSLMISKDQPPQASIVSPENDSSVIIEGQDISIVVEAIDDLGYSGIEKVVFYINNVPLKTVWQSISETDSNLYQAVFSPPQGLKGFIVHAVAYDILGHFTKTQSVYIGTIEDTVAPRLSLLSPVDGDILTASEAIKAVISVEDIGIESDRQVLLTFIREYRDSQTGEWHELALKTIQLYKNDERAPDDPTPVSEPDNHLYIYLRDFIDTDILKRTQWPDERVRTICDVITPYHHVSEEITNEIGIPVSQHYYLLPQPFSESSRNASKNIYYTAIHQFQSMYQTGSLIAAWATQDPMGIEPGLGNLTESGDDVECYPQTGIFILDTNTSIPDDSGNYYTYSELLSETSEIFTGTINEIHADEHFVLASKMGTSGLDKGKSEFTKMLESSIQANPDTGRIDTIHSNGELLIYTIQNGDGQFGLPYLLKGRIDMPYPDVFGLDRIHDLVLVANGYGGVQVINIQNISAPYHIGFIKPNGFVRDVVAWKHYAIMAASHEGIVIADLTEPSLPVISSQDTLGVCNRLFVEGMYVYATDMAGDGMISQLNVINIKDPYHPRIKKIIPIKPARKDLKPDGVYDLYVSAGKAYVTVLYSDQEDKPAQSFIEIIDLTAEDSSTQDTSIPGKVHRKADSNDFASRGIILESGGIQTAASKQGICRFEFPNLSIIKHSPGKDEEHISPDTVIHIECSGLIQENTDLKNFVRINETDPRMGRDICYLFDIQFGEKDGSPELNRIVIQAKNGNTLKANTKYYVTIKKGLPPISGLPLNTDVQFGFITKASQHDMSPHISSCEPSAGTIDGNTTIVITGNNFGDNPVVYIGGQRLIINNYTPADISGETFDQIITKTLPNYPGPATIEIVGDHHLSDRLIGGFSYVDLLEITMIDPPVVNVSQKGVGDQVNIVGNGFHGGIRIRAYQSGKPDTAVTTGIKDDTLALYSSQKMKWTVPDFGTSFRGFVDIEIDDQKGQIFISQNALFYGHLQIDRQIEVELSETKEIIDPNYIQDPMKLPPGRISDIYHDSNLNLIYVLGVPYLTANSLSTYTLESFYQTFEPGWISLIHYNRNAVADAAPMHGLGYMNLPQDLHPSTMVLSKDYLYVSAEGLSFPYIDTAYEDKVVILVYERETRLPGNSDTMDKNRDIVYSIPINFKNKIISMAICDNLLFASGLSDGVAVISLSDPEKPSVIKTIDSGIVNGKSYSLKNCHVKVANNKLHVFEKYHFIFDISKPTLPQIMYRECTKLNALPNNHPLLVSSDGNHLGFILDDFQSNYIQRLSQYDSNGFSISAFPARVFAQTTLGGTISEETTSENNTAYLALFDFSHYESISLSDALKIDLIDQGDRIVQSILSEDGILSLASQKQVILIDTMTQELVEIDPKNNSSGIPVNTDIRLTYSHPLSWPDGESFETYYAHYLNLNRDDGSQTGQSIPFSLTTNDLQTVITLIPDDNLLPDQTYQLTLKEAPGSFRTSGLLHFESTFHTGADTHPGPEILSIDPSVVKTEGGALTLTIRHAQTPDFLFAGSVGHIISQIHLSETIDRFVVQAPDHYAGPAELLVRNSNSGEDRLIGAVQYMLPLQLTSIAPSYGSINGGTIIMIKGQGFQSGMSGVKIMFSGIAVPDDHIIVADSETMYVISPTGQIGSSNITIQTAYESVTLKDAFHYQQPIQSNIFNYDTEHQSHHIYDMAIDPTGTYLMTASGLSGLVIYHIDASRFTNDENHPLNPDDLRQMIDLNNDHIDDRILAQISLPNNFYALGVAPFFERGLDRVLVTAGKPNSNDGHLFIISFDPNNLSHSSIIKTLPLTSNFAKGIKAINNKAVIAMGNKGLGIIDIYVHDKAYVTDTFQLPHGEWALDIERLPSPFVPDTFLPAPEKTLYAVVASQFDIPLNLIQDSQDKGRFYIVEHRAEQGFTIISQLDISASRVLIQGTTAYLSAGDVGVIIVDISAPEKPEIISRISDYAYVYDISLSDNVLYLALGKQGIASVDITDPKNPVLTRGMEAFDDNIIETILSTHYSVIGAGHSELFDVIQVTPDVVLKAFCLNNGILDQDEKSRSSITIRFNKAIDLWPDNARRFKLTGPQEKDVPFNLEIINNDAIISLDDSHELVAGDRILITARAGIASIKPITEDQTLVLYTLKSDQIFEVTYRGEIPETILSINTISPRRILVGKENQLVLSGTGIPSDIQNIKVFIGDIPTKIIDNDEDSTNSSISLLQIHVPKLSVPGFFDISLYARRLGIWERAVLYGGVMVDQALRFDSISPSWGPVTGGTCVTIYGQGFDPGNTVMNGLKIAIGNVPVSNIHVLSTQCLTIITPGGSVGKNRIWGKNRYGHETIIKAENGFGFGLKHRITQGTDFFPSRIYVDSKSGIAMTNGGYFSDNHELQQFSEYTLPDGIRAAVFSVQQPDTPIMVGGSTILPGDEDGRKIIQKYFTYQNLLARFMFSNDPYRALSASEIEQYHDLQGTYLATAYDSISILPQQNHRTGHKRLYVASGTGGISCLNTDDQNGLQLISQLFDKESNQLVTEISQKGSLVFASRISASDFDMPPEECASKQSKDFAAGTIETISFQDPEDPVYLDKLNLHGSNAIVYDGQWIYAGGSTSYLIWNTIGNECGFFRDFSGSPPPNTNESTVERLHVFDQSLWQSYSFSGNVKDLLIYGDYLIAALGNHGVQIVQKERPDLRQSIQLSEGIQVNSGDIERLKRYANLLFMAAQDGGIIVANIADPMNPVIISAGNTEPIDDLDIYKDRLICVSSTNGVSYFELPGSLVLQTSVDENHYIADNEGYTVTFNEPVSIESLKQEGAVRIMSMDTQTSVPFTIHPVKESEDNTQQFVVNFQRTPGLSYEIQILEARNIRNSGLWTPFTAHVRAATASAIRPEIHFISGGIRHLNDSSDMIITGQSFRSHPHVKVWIDQYDIPYQYISDHELAIDQESLKILPIEAGVHHLGVSDNEFFVDSPDPLIFGASPENMTFILSSASGSVNGGKKISIVASEPVILPGTKVVMTSLSGIELRTELISDSVYVNNLFDDVIDLYTFQFQLPVVVKPEVYQISLLMNGTSILVGHFSYEKAADGHIDFPNYPPMTIGDAQVRESLIFIGVNHGESATESNRFLMPSGLEIYDISIEDRPIRLSQLETEQSVNGLCVLDHLVFLACGTDGLLVANIQDPEQPLLIGKYGISGNIATDVALCKEKGILAMSVVNPLGGGYIRFFDITDPDMDPPERYATIYFSEPPLSGFPLNIQWQGDTFLVLLNQDGHLVLSEFMDIYNKTYYISTIQRGETISESVFDDSMMAVNFHSQFGQMSLINSGEYILLEKSSSESYSAVFWKTISEDSNELLVHDGSIFSSTMQGITRMPTMELLITDVFPSDGSDMAFNESIRITFNDHINTAPEFLKNGITLTDLSGEIIPYTAFTITGINQIYGAYVDISFHNIFPDKTDIRLLLSNNILSLDGMSLMTPIEYQYRIIQGIRPTIERVFQLMDNESKGPYFHADGTEQAVITGHHFGNDKTAFRLTIGDKTIDSKNILAIEDSEIKFIMPIIDRISETTSLSVGIQKNQLSSIVHGAVIIQSRVVLQRISPASGPPSGGQTVHLYGIGFHHHLDITFGDVPAGIPVVRSSNHIEIQVPAGNFGFVDVSMASQMFPDERSTLESGYFYANKENGGINLSDNKSLDKSPIADLVVKDDILYAVTGGTYDVMDRNGKASATLSSASANFLVADISDPVHPQLISKQIAEQEEPYHLSLLLQPIGFQRICTDQDHLFIAGNDYLFHFNISLPAEPFLVEKINLRARLADMLAENGILFVSTINGISIFKLSDESRLNEIDYISIDYLKAVPGNMNIHHRLLWVNIPESQEIIGLDLCRGDYSIRHRIPVLDTADVRHTPSHILSSGDLLMVSCGLSGIIICYD
ncbi:Cell surface receptor IPT/TIG domain protein, partial [Candidatus Magnetomorum sp. HK-1]